MPTPISLYRVNKQRFGKLLIPRLPVSRHVFDHFRLEVNACYVRGQNLLNPMYRRRRSAIGQAVEISANIGCGGSGKPGWVNLDLMSHANLTLRYDCRRCLPFARGSVRRIRCEHFFEHLDIRDEVPNFLASCFEALALGGTLRIVVPDAGKYLSAYQRGDSVAWAQLGWNIHSLPQGFHTALDVINHVFRQGHEHGYAYDYETLAVRLYECGFGAVQRAAFGQSCDPELRDDLEIHRPYSLYVEAVK